MALFHPPHLTLRAVCCPRAQQSPLQAFRARYISHGRFSSPPRSSAMPNCQFAAFAGLETRMTAPLYSSACASVGSRSIRAAARKFRSQLCVLDCHPPSPMANARALFRMLTSAACLDSCRPLRHRKAKAIGAHDGRVTRVWGR